MIQSLVVIVGIIAGGLVSLAHDQDGNANWIAKGKYSSPIDGSHCCGVHDCFELPAHDVQELAGGSYLIVKTNEVIPAREVQTSKDGHFWRCMYPGGKRRCFFAPPKAT